MFSSARRQELPLRKSLLGLHEGSPNTHPGQGTANRRFFFANAMLELLWVSNEADAKGLNTRRTLLWERWSGRERSASPFGICLRPIDAQDVPPPFPGWEYRPAYLPDSMSIHIGEGGCLEPMWFYLQFMRRGHHEQQFMEHTVDPRDHVHHSDHAGIYAVSGIADDRERHSRDTIRSKISHRD